MNLKVCEHPVRIFDKKLRKFTFVRCGKCNTCTNLRQSSWVQRLEEESKCWKYSVFFTLTFDDDNVPCFTLSPDNSYLCDLQTGLNIDLDDLQGYSNRLSPVERRLYICRRRNIPYVNVKYAQDFMKRLRYYFYSLIKNTYDQKVLRYFIISEYGASLYRPHLHGILWFNSETFAKSIQTCISKAWSFGRIDCSFVKSSACSYVARYCNSVTALPRVYLHKELRPFCIFSKQPAIGSLLSTSQELYQIFINGTVSRTIEDYKSLSVRDVPLWRSFESRLFPKIKSFNVLSHRDRVTLYSVFRQSQAENFNVFLTWCFNIIRSHNNAYYPIRTFLSSFLNDMYNENLKSSCPDKYYSFRNLYYVSSHVYHQRVIFGVSLDTYVSCIENYYSNKELYKLRNFYSFQSDLSNRLGDPLPLIFMYDNTDNLFSDILKNYTLPYYLNTLGIDPSDYSLFVVEKLYNAKEIFDSMSFIQSEFNRKIQIDSMKTKKKNDYLDWVSKHSVYKHKLNFNFYRNYE